MSKSALENELARQIELMKLPEPVREYKFCRTRKFRADFAWPDHWLLVEVQGGHWTRGRHTRGSGYEKDCQRFNIAMEEGYRVLLYTAKDIKDWSAVKQIARFLACST